MPELRAGTPQVYPAGQDLFQRATAYYGMEWLNPLAYKMPGAGIIMTELAAGPPPPNTTWTDAALLSAVTPPGFWDQPITNKMIGLVRSYLYAQYVVDTPGDPVPPAPTPPPVPPTFPVPLPPIEDLPIADPINDNVVQVVKLLHRIESQLTWARKQLPTREYIEGPPVSISGHGQKDWFLTGTGGSDDYDVAPMGFRIHVLSKPNYAGHSEPPEPQIYYRLGTVSWGRSGYMSPPWNLTRLNFIVFPIEPQEFTLYYALSAGVTAQASPLYPSQWDGTRPD